MSNRDGDSNKAKRTRTRQKQDADLFTTGSSIINRRIREGKSVNREEWSSQEMSNLYILLKQFGTSDAALEFIAAFGLNRTHEQVVAKIDEIREMIHEDKVEKVRTLKRKYEDMGNGNLENMLENLPINPINRYIHGHWNTASLAITSHFRSFDHNAMKEMLSTTLMNIPAEKIDNLSVSDSPFNRQPNTTMDLNYEEIRKSLIKIATFPPKPPKIISEGQNTSASEVQDASTSVVANLNSLESAVVLNILQELWAEAFRATDVKQKAVLRGFLKRLGNYTLRDNLVCYPDFPCDELSATRLFMEPLRTREWDIPENARKLSRTDVGAFCPVVEPADFDETEDNIQRPDVLTIEASEANSSRYPPTLFYGKHALKSVEQQGCSLNNPDADEVNSVNNSGILNEDNNLTMFLETL